MYIQWIFTGVAMVEAHSCDVYTVDNYRCCYGRGTQLRCIYSGQLPVLLWQRHIAAMYIQWIVTGVAMVEAHSCDVYTVNIYRCCYGRGSQLRCIYSGYLPVLLWQRLIAVMHIQWIFTNVANLLWQRLIAAMYIQWNLPIQDTYLMRTLPAVPATQRCVQDYL